MQRCLVIGGTGPTGPFVVDGLLQRGYEVTILHTGRHEVDGLSSEVVHIHTDPFDGGATAEALGAAHHKGEFDLAVVMYGRLRVLVGVLAGRVGRLITIGGVGAIRGWVDPGDLFPTSMTVPAPLDAPLAPDDEPIGKIRRIVETERAVFDNHPGAIHLRYPMLYGPRQLIPREWPLVRRALDRRPAVILPDGGLTLKSAAYGPNAAHAVLCAVDALDRIGVDASVEHELAGAYNVADDRALTLRQMAEVVAAALGHRFEFVTVPYELAAPARPLVMHSTTGHRVVNTERLRTRLGYRDLVEPEDGLRQTVEWLVEHRPSEEIERRLQDPFDYAAEDALIARWRSTLAAFEVPAFSTAPGYGPAYYGREPNPATGTSRMEPR